MFLGDIILKYRKDNQLSQREFAKKCGLSHTYIAALEKNIDIRSGKPITPTLDAFKSICIGMNIGTQELLNVLDEGQEFTITSSISPTHLPVLGRIPAGIPIEMIEDVIDYEDISEDMLKGGKEYFALKVTGNSMEPKYLDGDVLIVLKAEDCESGQDAIIAVNGFDATFKRVFKTEQGITLQPLNNEYMPVFYSNEDVKNKPVKILGVVKEIRRTV